MVVMFLSREPDVCEEIAVRLKNEGYIVSVFSNQEIFFNALKLSYGAVDFLVIDYGFFDHFSFNIFSYLKQNGWMLPVIFYNTPYPPRDCLCESWYSQNEEQMPGIFNTISEEAFKTFTRILQETVNDAVLCEHISLLCQPKPLDKDAMQVQKTFTVKAFQIKHSLGPVKIRLFQKLYDNLDCGVSAETLCRYVWGEYSEKIIKTLYAYISDLRRCCKEENDYVMDIVRAGAKRYKLMFARRESELLHSIKAREAFESKRYLFFDEEAPAYNFSCADGELDLFST